MPRSRPTPPPTNAWELLEPSGSRCVNRVLSLAELAAAAKAAKHQRAPRERTGRLPGGREPTASSLLAAPTHRPRQRTLPS
jgi:hypothetical protein